MRYLIVGTGPSVNELDFNNIKIDDEVIIISVNTSILFLPYADIWFSIDPSTKNVKCSKIALNKSVLVAWAISDKNKMARNYANRLDNIYLFDRVENKHYLKNPVSEKDWFSRWGCIKGLSETPPRIHGGNSLYGALNLAFFDRPNKIAILGLDGTQKRSVGGNHLPNNLIHLPMLFDSTIPQLNENEISVLNGSPHSNVNCFERSSPSEAIEWINTIE